MKTIIHILLLFIGCFALQAQPISIEQLLSSPFPTNLTKSPDGTHLAWVFNEEGKRNIYVANHPDFIPEQVTDFKDDDGQTISQLAFSEDNNTILFVRGDSPNRQGESPNPSITPDWPDQLIMRLDLQTNQISTIDQGHHPVFLPGQKKVLFIRRGDAYIWDQDSMKSNNLFTIRGGVSELKPSSDGVHIAFTSLRGTHGFIGIYNLEEKTLKYIDPTVDSDGSIEWSPEGDALVFIRQKRERNRLPFYERREGLGWSIMHHLLENAATTELWSSPPGTGSVFKGISARNQLLWAQNNQIVFPYEGDGWTHLYALGIDDQSVKLLTPGPGEVQYVSLSHDRSLVYYSCNIDDIDRQHIWQTDIKTGQIEQITRGTGIEWSPISLINEQNFCLNSDGIIPARVSKITEQALRSLAPQFMPGHFSPDLFRAPEAITFQSPDGLTIHGQLFKPTDYDPTQKYPAILFFHGGSRRQMLLGYHHRGYYHHAFALNQYLANAGYLVLAVNYRSGIGYGMEFREAENYGANGASEYNDVLGAGHYLQQRNDVLDDKIGLWGGSYGGYLTALGLSRNSDLFKVGVDIHGVHDWNVVINNFVPGYVEEHHPEVRKRAIESSPMHFMDTWESPVLLIHGDDDRNVPFSETVDLVEELRKRDVYFEQLIFPDEVHGFLLHQNWVNAYKATVDFFNRHLKN